MQRLAKWIVRAAWVPIRRCAALLHKQIITRRNLARLANQRTRMLDIGPGALRLPGFETLDVVLAPRLDYLVDASDRLPFKDGVFDVVHASHVLEHLPWHKSAQVLREWARIVKSGGSLEVWVPDGYKICRLLCDVEEGNPRQEWQDAWRPMNEDHDPYKWVNGRLLYGVRDDYPSWHRAVFTPASLHRLLEGVGLTDIQRLTRDQARAVDHGWINLGFRGTKH